jgi:flagella basal body P-ring formation protein FlgA
MMRLLLATLLVCAAVTAASAQSDDDRARAAIVAAVHERMGGDAAVDVEAITVTLHRPSTAAWSATPDPGGRLGQPVRFTLASTEQGPNGPRVTVIGSALATLRVAVPHFHLRRAVAPGEFLAESDLEPADHALTGTPLKALSGVSGLVGGRVLRTLAAQACLTPGTIAAVTAVRTGQSVTAISRFAGGEISATLVASEAGDPGKVIRVVNPHSRRALRARVLSPGVVEILP